MTISRWTDAIPRSPEPVEGLSVAGRTPGRSLFSDTSNRRRRDRRLAAVPDARDLAEDFDLRRLPDSFYDDPYPNYRALREHAPVKRMPDGAWFLTPLRRHRRRSTATRRPSARTRSEEFGPKYGASPLFEHHTTSLVFNDPPLHTRVRRLIVGALTPRHIAAMEPGLVALVDGLLDATSARARQTST